MARTPPAVPWSLERALKDQASVILKDVDERLDEQTTVILEAVDEKLAEKLDERIDPVHEQLASVDKRLAKLEEKIDPIMIGIDKIMKKLETYRDEDQAGARQPRRHEDKLDDHESRIKILEAHEPGLRRPWGFPEKTMAA